MVGAVGASGRLELPHGHLPGDRIVPWPGSNPKITAGTLNGSLAETGRSCLLGQLGRLHRSCAEDRPDEVRASSRTVLSSEGIEAATSACCHRAGREPESRSRTRTARPRRLRTRVRHRAS